MPYVTEIIDDGTGIRRIGTGVVTGQEIIKENLAIHAVEIDFSKLTHVLVDFEGVTELQLTSEETRRIAEQIKDNVKAGLWKHLVVAIAAPSDLAYGMARMFSVFVADGAVEIKAFRSKAEASEWIDGKRAGQKKGQLSKR